MLVPLKAASVSGEPILKPRALNDIRYFGSDSSAGITSRARPSIFKVSDLAPVRDRPGTQALRAECFFIEGLRWYCFLYRDHSNHPEAV